ncbi:MAG: amidase [Gammaproteobacteria bacterium]|nr:amidase [Gammaproteobacteria bacterium]
MSLVELAQRIAVGDCSSEEATQACIERIERLQPSLNCFISFDPDGALEQAREADRRRSAGEPLGPLHGVPLAHKDMFYREGVVTTCGSKIRADFRPDRSATVLERLRTAGALHLGGLNMAEFASGPTGHNAHYGACRNPWNTDFITGGSSSGSGSAVAARLVHGALGSDTGGSVRLPAAACGLFGMKGTQTRVSRYGCMGLSFSMDNIGPLTRTTRDCARLFQLIAGHDPNDPTSSRMPVPDYESMTIDADLEGLRIGVPGNYFCDDLDDCVSKVVAASLQRLQAAGATLVEVELPFAETIGGLGTAISGTEALALHRAWLRDRPHDYGPQVRARYMMNLGIPAADYLAVVQARPRVIQGFVEKVFGACDVLHCPVFPFALPTIAATDVEDQQGFEQLLAATTRLTRPLNFLGLPALSVPGGFCANGLPVGLQLVGRPYSEATLFRAGAAYEAISGCAQWAPDI